MTATRPTVDRDVAVGGSRRRGPGSPRGRRGRAIDGAMRGEARASSRRGRGGALEERLAVMPDDTWANPLVGSDAGQPITKLAALNGVCWPTRISPALTQHVDDARRRRAVGRRRPGGARGRSGWRRAAASSRSATSTQPPFAPSAARGRGRPHLRQVGELAGELGVDRVGERRRDVVTQHDRRVGAVLRLDQQVGGERGPGRPCRRRYDALRRPEQHHRRRRRGAASRPGRSVTAGEPGPTTLRTRGIVSVPNPSAAMPAGPLTRNTSVDAELAAHDEHGRVDLAGAAGHGRHDERDRAARRRRRPARRAGRRRSGSSPCRDGTNSPTDAIGVTFSPTTEPGLALEPPVAAAVAAAALVERARWAMASSIAASTSGDTRRGGDLVGGDPQLVRLELDAVEAGAARRTRRRRRGRARRRCSAPIDSRSAGSKMSSSPRRTARPARPRPSSPTQPAHHASSP